MKINKIKLITSNKVRNVKNRIEERTLKIEKEIIVITNKIIEIDKDIKWIDEAISFCDNPIDTDDMYKEFIFNNKQKLNYRLDILIKKLSILKY